MSWSDVKALRTMLVAAAAAAMLAGCQVRPLYAPAASGSAGAPARIASVAIKPVSTREAQQVRNHLIFLVNGGAGEAAILRRLELELDL